MIVGLASVKGSPGATSTALALAAVWPAAVVLLEADPAGGDLAFRCRAAHGGSMHAARSVISLAAAVRDGVPRTEALADHSQRLSCGVDVVQGVSGAGQTDGLASLWPRLRDACRRSDHDVIIDLGRLDHRSPTLPLVEAADRLLLIANPTLGSVLHVADALPVLSPVTAPSGRAEHITPVLVGPDATARQDCVDLDDVLARTGMRVAAASSVPYDRDALQRLESGERASGRLGRTLLIRAARRLAAQLRENREQVPA